MRDDGYEVRLDDGPWIEIQAVASCSPKPGDPAMSAEDAALGAFVIVALALAPGLICIALGRCVEAIDRRKKGQP